MNFSSEQEAIFQYAAKGPFNMIVQAVAGAGKTTTLVECVNRISPEKRILLLAHNKSTRDTLNERVGQRDNVNIFTLHGLAWRMYTEHFGSRPEINDDKYRTYINKNIKEEAGEKYAKLPRAKKMMYKANVFDLVNKARHNLKQSEKEIKKLAERKYGIKLVADEPQFVAKVLKWGEENRAEVDFQDMLWFPHEFGYTTKRYLADIIMLDEAQDASLAQQDVIKRCMKRESRLFGFGDKWQTINSWCGSDADSFKHLMDPDEFRRPAVELPLTTCYRCDKNIIEFAKNFTDNGIKARNEAEDGIVKMNSYLSEVKDGDMILCRNISPLMEVYRRGVANGQRMYFRGEALGTDLLQAADCAEGDTIEEIINSMKRRLIATWDFVTKEMGGDEHEAASDARLLSLLDAIKTMENLPRTVETRRDLEKFAKDVFTDEGKGGIQLSTIHRAKGLEADNVFIVCPSLIPSRLAHLDWQIQEERNLQYVMCTRPKHSLNFISESEVAPYMAFAEMNSFHKTLDRIRDDISSIQWEA